MSESDDSDIDPFIPDENPEDFEVPAFEEFGITGDESGSDDSVIPNNSDADLLDRIEALEARINSFPLPQPLPTVFIVQSGTGTTWDEVVPVNGTLTTGGPRTFTGDTVSGAALITLTSNQSVVVESKDPGTTENYTRFVAISGGGVATSTYARLTSVLSTISATTWLYEATFPDGATDNAYNGMEWNGTTSGILSGSPGSLGVTVGTDGSVTGTACFVKPIGDTGWVPFIFDTDNARWTFALPNSAGT